MWVADEDRIGVELSPLNTAFVEVHRKLATVHNRAQDIVMKKKRLKKAKTYVLQQLDNAQKKITDIEQLLETMRTTGHPPAEVTRL